MAAGSKSAKPHTVLDVLKMVFPSLTHGAYVLEVKKDGTISIFQAATVTRNRKSFVIECLYPLTSLQTSTSEQPRP